MRGKPGGAADILDSAATSRAGWQTACKTYSVCKKYPAEPTSRVQVFPFYRGAVGRWQRNFFGGLRARAEAYWVVKRCCRVRRVEREACRVVRLAIETGVRRTPMRAATARSGKAHATAVAADLSVPFELPFALESRAPHRLPPPSDGYPDVVASRARAVCADRATPRGSPRRSTKARLSSSSATHLSFARKQEGSSIDRSCRGGTTFFGYAGRQ